jgi:hypothetical protein
MKLTFKQTLSLMDELTNKCEKLVVGDRSC